MSQTCTRCDGTGFLNLHQAPPELVAEFDKPGEGEGQLLVWMAVHAGEHDVAICDCCGIPDNFKTVSDGGWSNLWHGERGEHYNEEDPPGMQGPYAYNNGLCECH